MVSEGGPEDRVAQGVGIGFKDGGLVLGVGAVISGDYGGWNEGPPVGIHVCFNI